MAGTKPGRFPLNRCFDGIDGDYVAQCTLHLFRLLYSGQLGLGKYKAAKKVLVAAARYTSRFQVAFRGKVIDETSELSLISWLDKKLAGSVVLIEREQEGCTGWRFQLQLRYQLRCRPLMQNSLSAQSAYRRTTYTSSLCEVGILGATGQLSQTARAQLTSQPKWWISVHMAMHLGPFSKLTNFGPL